MITYDYELMSDLTIELAQNEVKYIHVTGLCNSINWSLKLLTAGATASIKTFLESDEFTKGSAIILTDLLTQDIKISGTPTASIVADTLNETQSAPNGIYIKNTSPATQRIRFSIRGNR